MNPACARDNSCEIDNRLTLLIAHRGLRLYAAYMTGSGPRSVIKRDAERAKCAVEMVEALFVDCDDRCKSVIRDLFAADTGSQSGCKTIPPVEFEAPGSACNTWRSLDYNAYHYGVTNGEFLGVSRR